MLLTDLITITSLGAKKPLELWHDRFTLEAPVLAESLEKVYKTLEDDTDVKNDLSTLINLLKQDDPNEFFLAGGLLRLSGVFLTNTPEDKKEIIQRYFKTSREFHKRAQAGWLHKQQRFNLKKTLDEKKQSEYDLRLFQSEGMTYVLEFYLTLYKAIMEAPSEKEKRSFIENKEVNLGFGGVPCLLEDFQNDEALEKFIYKILNNERRQRLIQAYYEFKIDLVSDRIETLKVQEGFKKFLYELLFVFQEVGITQLSSAFFKPFGDKPTLSEIKL